MGFLDQVRTKGAEVGAQLKTKVQTFKSEDFAKASMAMCALIAAADGSIEDSERERTGAFIRSNDILSVFPSQGLIADFERFCSKLQSDRDLGRIDVIQVIGKVKGKADQARAVIQIGMVIGSADGQFDDSEKQAVRDACFACGLDPSEFGV